MAKVMQEEVPNGGIYRDHNDLNAEDQETVHFVPNVGYLEGRNGRTLVTCCDKRVSLGRATTETNKTTCADCRTDPSFGR